MYQILSLSLSLFPFMIFHLRARVSEMRIQKSIHLCTHTHSTLICKNDLHFRNQKGGRKRKEEEHEHRNKRMHMSSCIPQCSPGIEFPLLIWLVFIIDMFVHHRLLLLLGTACIGAVHHVVVRLLLIHCRLVTQKGQWSVGERGHAVRGILARRRRMIVVVLGPL
jgi:hypothetical protein